MQLVRNLPQQYREDPWVLALADAILGVLEDQDAQSVSIREQLSLDTITWALEIEEALAGIVPPADAALKNRRSTLKAKLRSSGKVTIELIQAVCDAWKNGEVVVSFTGGKIRLQFVGAYGVPADLDALKAAVRLVIPAHLAAEYAIKYLLIRDIHEVMAISTLETQPLGIFAF